MKRVMDRKHIRVFSFSLRLQQYTYAFCVFLRCYLVRSPTEAFFQLDCAVRVQLWCQQPRSVAMVRSDGWRRPRLVKYCFHFTKLSFRVSQCLPNILSQIQKENVSTLACIWALDCSAAAWGGTLCALAKKPKKQAVAPKLRNGKTHAS